MKITHPSLFLTFLLFSTCLLLCCSAHTGGEVKTGDRHHERQVIKVSSLLPSTFCSNSTSIKGLSKSASFVEIVHARGPCSPSQLGQGTEKTKTPDQSLKQDLLQDELRVASLQRIFSSDSKRVQGKKSDAALSSPSMISQGPRSYIFRVGFGTPTKNLDVIFDTCSDLTWIQCEPCSKYCYRQQDTFDPTESTSFFDVSCKTNECAQLVSATSVSPGCFAPTSTCTYRLQYDKQTYSNGLFGTETFKFTQNDVIPNFQFGCGQNTRDLYEKASGLLGLGRNRVSFASQTAKRYGGVFSYCLPSSPSSTGYLALGSKVSSTVKYTPLLTDSRAPSFYFVDLIDISVGWRRLGVSASMAASSGTFIDSGTLISRLPPAAYAALRANFRQFMSTYQSVQPQSSLDTCYDFSGYDSVSVPNIALFFRGGIKVDLDVQSVLVTDTASQVCLAFAGNSASEDVNILGNKLQQNLEVVFDVPNGRMGFGPGSCK